MCIVCSVYFILTDLDLYVTLCARDLSALYALHCLFQIYIALYVYIFYLCYLLYIVCFGSMGCSMDT